MIKKALIDNDGILFEHRRGMIKYIAQILGKPLTETFLDHFYQTTLSMDDGELINAFSSPEKNLHQLLNSDSHDSFAADVTIYEKVREGLVLLKQSGFITYLVTARTERMREITKDALVRHHLIGYIDVIFMRQDINMSSPNFKSETAVAIGITHAFEDTFLNLAAVAEKCPSLQKAYLVNQPWNKKHEEDELYPTHYAPIERMESFHHAALDAVATLK